MTSTRRPQLILLVGLMGAGKTSVGRRVASLLGWPFVDNDEAFVARTGMTAAAYAQRHSDDAMHAVEREVFGAQLTASRQAVLAAAGSVAADPDLDLPDVFVVYLRATPARLADRVDAGDHRPLLEVDPVDVLAEMAAARDHPYRRLADLVVEIDDRSPDELAHDIVDAWRNTSA